jgi:hypothetical protein
VLVRHLGCGQADQYIEKPAFCSRCGGAFVWRADIQEHAPKRPPLMLDIKFEWTAEGEAFARERLIDRWQLVEHAGGCSVRHVVGGWVMDGLGVAEWPSRAAALAWVEALVDAPRSEEYSGPLRLLGVEAKH